MADSRSLRRAVFVWLVGAALATPAEAAGAAHAAHRTPGDQTWAFRDAGPGGADDRFAGMALAPNGASVYVARSSGGSFVVVARDAATGERRWTARTPGPDGTQAFAEAIAVSRDGSRVFVTGDVEWSLDTRGPMTVAYDTSDGSVRWFAAPRVGDHREIVPRRIVAAGSHVFVTGSRTGRSGVDDFWDYWTVGYSAATGVRRWQAIYAGPAHGGDTAEGLAVGAHGTRVFVTGTSAASGSDRGIATVAYSATDGSRLWTTRFTHDADAFATDVRATADGSRVFVAGSARVSGSAPQGFRLLGYDGATGGHPRVARFDDGTPDFAAALALSADGTRAFVVGGGDQDFLTVAFDTSNMSAAWFAHYDGGHGTDAAFAVAVSPHATRVDVAGASDEGVDGCFGETPSAAFATVEYRASNGDQRWSARYAGRNRHPDQAGAVAVNPDRSTVVVAGDADAQCGNGDVATVAYSTG